MKITVNQALQIIYENRGVVKNISSSLNDQQNWPFILEQLKNPESNRPLKAISKYANRTKYLDLKKNKWTNRTIYGARGRAKNTKFIKKTSVTLVPSNGKIILFPVKFPVGILFDLTLCNTKNEKYIFSLNASTNNKWWIKNNNNDINCASTTIQALINLNKKAVLSGHAPDWNELLISPCKEALSAVFAPVDDLATRLNTQLRREQIKNELAVELPLLIMTNNAAVREYTKEMQTKDLLNAKKSPTYSIEYKFYLALGGEKYIKMLDDSNWTFSQALENENWKKAIKHLNAGLVNLNSCHENNLNKLVNEILKISDDHLLDKLIINLQASKKDALNQNSINSLLKHYLHKGNTDLIERCIKNSRGYISSEVFEIGIRKNNCFFLLNALSMVDKRDPACYLKIVEALYKEKHISIENALTEFNILLNLINKQEYASTIESMLCTTTLPLPQNVIESLLLHYLDRDKNTMVRFFLEKYTGDITPEMLCIAIERKNYSFSIDAILKMQSKNLIFWVKLFKITDLIVLMRLGHLDKLFNKLLGEKSYAILDELIANILSTGISFYGIGANNVLSHYLNSDKTDICALLIKYYNGKINKEIIEAALLKKNYDFLFNQLINKNIIDITLFKEIVSALYKENYINGDKLNTLLNMLLQMQNINGSIDLRIAYLLTAEIPFDEKNITKLLAHYAKEKNSDLILNILLKIDQKELTHFNHAMNIFISKSTHAEFLKGIEMLYSAKKFNLPTAPISENNKSQARYLAIHWLKIHLKKTNKIEDVIATYEKIKRDFEKLSYLSKRRNYASFSFSRHEFNGYKVSKTFATIIKILKIKALESTKQSTIEGLSSEQNTSLHKLLNEKRSGWGTALFSTETYSACLFKKIQNPKHKQTIRKSLNNEFENSMRYLNKTAG